ncbi:PucR family transcriptional regulator [Aquibacillus halophilus]|uniref:PucR family transcriptional regulator n=1 Tax=Aquibacillus halophilus TaxID=930132 RepID=A0A6A8DKL4_9BACI|nr:PucR family transcriptional regulator [Aquibacillus halophilus]MRH44299.1 PucR family transcriptional regulator [Aquibacillus halophilus]
MGLSAGGVLKLPIMKSCKVKTSNHIMKEKPIEWISVIEMPVENFVRKNEFVLSTGIGCEDKPELLEKFVRDVIQSGASVLAFATGRYIFDIPDRVLELADEHDLVIIDVPWEIRFADILQTVMHEITVDKQKEREKAEDVRHELINCVLHDKGLEEIAHSLYRHIKIPVAITDATRIVRANKHFSPVIIKAYSGEDQENKLQRTPLLDIQFSEHPLYYHMKEYKYANEVFFQLKILNNHKTQGYVIFQPSESTQLSWFVMNVLEHALTACALYFVKENAIELTEIRLKDNFVLNLAKNKTRVDEQLSSKAKLLGYDLNLSYICIVGNISYKDSKQSKKQEENPSNSSLQSMNYYIQKEITYAGKLFSRRTMTTFDEGEVILYLEADHLPYGDVANQFLDTIERRLSQLLTDVEISWGVAADSESEFAFYESYDEASTALDIGLQHHGTGERTFFSDTRINRLLMAISEESEIASIVKDTLQPLLDYDKKRQTDLIYTLKTYNKYKGNVSQTARELNLHRQSLLHRLRKIESLTKLSLIESDDSFLLELSVRLWMLNKLK